MPPKNKTSSKGKRKTGTTTKVQGESSDVPYAAAYDPLPEPVNVLKFAITSNQNKEDLPVSFCPFCGKWGIRDEMDTKQYPRDEYDSVGDNYGYEDRFFEEEHETFLETLGERTNVMSFNRNFPLHVRTCAWRYYSRSLEQGLERSHLLCKEFREKHKDEDHLQNHYTTTVDAILVKYSMTLSSRHETPYIIGPSVLVTSDGWKWFKEMIKDLLADHGWQPDESKEYIDHTFDSKNVKFKNDTVETLSLNTKLDVARERQSYRSERILNPSAVESGDNFDRFCIEQLRNRHASQAERYVINLLNEELREGLLTKWKNLDKESMYDWCDDNLGKERDDSFDEKKKVSFI